MAEATEQVRDLLRDDFLLANNAEKRSDLAGRLLELGEKTVDKPVLRYACFLLAREQAGKVGDPQLIEKVVRRLEQEYQVDVLYLHAETVAEAWRSDYSVPHRVTLFKRSQELLASALAADNYAAAGHAIRVVMAGTRAAKDYRLLRELEETRKRIRASAEAPGP